MFVGDETDVIQKNVLSVIKRGYHLCTVDSMLVSTRYSANRTHCLISPRLHSPGWQYPPLAGLLLLFVQHARCSFNAARKKVDAVHCTPLW